MSWLSGLRRGFQVSWSRCWPGDEKLNKPDPWPKPITQEDVEKEIEESLHKQKEPLR